MKWFRITSPFWQLLILLSLAMLLGWDSEPVPGPDGRIVCELYEFPLDYMEHRHSISLYPTPPGMPSAKEIFNQSPLVNHAPILRTIKSNPIKPLQWITTQVPFLKVVLPKKYQYRIDGGRVLVVSVTPDEWKRLNKGRKEDIELVWMCYTK